MPVDHSGKDPVDPIRRLYYKADRRSIGDDLARAIEIFKRLGSDDDRERAAVYMDGLSQMRSEWATAPSAPATPASRAAGHTGRRPASKTRKPRNGTPD